MSTVEVGHQAPEMNTVKTFLLACGASMLGVLVMSLLLSAPGCARPASVLLQPGAHVVQR